MELDTSLYTIAWIAPLEIEARAAAGMLDRAHDGRFPMRRGDDYVYKAGEICGHNVIIATLPAGQEYGTGSAAALASQVKQFFPNLWFGLLVGVAAGLPRLMGPSPRDIRLGDVLVALPEGENPGLVAYDLGKETISDGFQLLKGGHVLALTETVVRAAIGSIKSRSPYDVDVILPYYDKIENKEHGNDGRTFADPGQDKDRLYENDESGSPAIQAREPRSDERRTRIWYGPIGSGDKLMKNTMKRNELRDRYNIIGLEMEAAGTMNRLPVGVIRGVCDYGDEHKNKEWQPYAAAMAAAYAKAVLAQIGPRKPASGYIPFRRNHDFTGREAQLHQLERMLFREKRERVALVGLGGMGKTQIALELAYRVQNMEVEGMTERHSVFWVQAQSVAAFHKTAVEVVQRLNIQYGNDDPKEALQRYLASDAAGYWLLVVDNTDDAVVFKRPPDQLASVSDFLPRNPKGRLLITTRQVSVAVDTAGTAMIKLSSMTADDAYSLMEKLLLDKSQVQNTERTAKLLAKLTYLPLTLAQAAAYMNKHGTPIVRYLELCQSADQNTIKLLSRRLCDETHHSEAQGAVATTWIVSFEAIREADWNAIRLLSFLRWIEPKAIPISILPTLGSQIDLEESIGLLCGYGFLSWQEDGETVDMHSLVHLILEFWLDQQTNNSLMTEDDAIKHLSRIFPLHEWENRLVWRQFLPHVLTFLTGARLRRNKPLQLLCHKTGLCLHVDGRTTETVEVFKLLTSIDEDTLAEIHPDRLASQHQLAIAYENNGQVKEAIKILQHVVAIQKETLAETHPDRLASEHQLAAAYLVDGQVKEAIKILEHVVAIWKRILAKTHPSRLTSQHKLAVAYQANGQVKEAIKLLENVVAIEKDTLAEGHPSRLSSLHELAVAYRANGQVEKAIKILERVVAIQKETLAETHPDRLASHNNLAVTYQANGQVKEAIKLLEYVVAIREEALAKTHPERLASQRSLAGAYHADGQIKEAIKILEHVVAIQKETLAKTHPSRLASQHKLAVAYQANGQVKEAIKLLEDVVAIRKGALAKTHLDRLSSQHDLAVTYEANGQVKKAIKILEHVVAIRKETLAEAHPDRLASERALALAYKANGQVTETLAIKEETLADSYIPKHRFRWWKNKS